MNGLCFVLYSLFISKFVSIPHQKFILHFLILILGSFFAAWWQFNKQLRLIGCITIYLGCSLKKIIEEDKYVWGKTTILFAILQAISQKLKKKPMESVRKLIISWVNYSVTWNECSSCWKLHAAGKFSHFPFIEALSLIDPPMP